MRLAQKISNTYGITQERAGKLIIKDIKHYSLYRRWFSAKTLNQIIEQEVNRLQFSEAKEKSFQKALNRRVGKNRAKLFAKIFNIPEKMAHKLFVRRAKSFARKTNDIWKKFDKLGQEITWFEAQELAGKSLINKELNGRDFTASELKTRLTALRKSKGKRS